MNFKEAIQELRNVSEKRNFDQTIELIVNLKNFDPQRESINTFLVLENVQKKKVAAFLEKITKSEAVSKIFTKSDLEKITSKEMKKFSKEFDFFIASAKLMPVVASKFGKVLGAAGKMPDPKIGGVLMQEQEDILKQLAEKLEKTIKIKAKEKSLKIAIGKESMKDEILAESLDKTFKVVMAALPKKELNLRNVMIKFTMSKSIKVKA
jgi:ribosomal protein L1